MNLPNPQKGQHRIVILGGGFGGLKLARHLAREPRFQLLIIDRNNFHQFQPLLYQVATAGLESPSISFPLRKVFQNRKNVFIRVAEITGVETSNKTVKTSTGDYKYDTLVIALGTNTNYFGNQQLKTNGMGLKSVPEAIYLRNKLLKNYEKALVASTEEERIAALNMVIVGGGPTGVELAGAVAEMRNHTLPKEYPEIDFTKMEIVLIEALDRVLSTMSESSSRKAQKYLESLGVSVRLNTRVDAYDGQTVTTNNEPINSKLVVWAAGVKPVHLEGFPSHLLTKKGRIRTDEFNRVESLDNVYVVGDLAGMSTADYPDGHPQVAPAAIQQAKNLAKNLKRGLKNKSPKPFRYVDKGSMATVGRNLAVVELPFIKFGGLFAWFTWMFVHLMSIVGIKNRFFVFINWMSNYFSSSNLSLRLILSAQKDTSHEA